jgi:hypothetical protein
MTIPAYGAAGTSAAGTGDITPTIGTHATGNLLILAVQSRQGESVAAPTDWTAVPGGMVTTGASASCRLTLFYKIAASGAESNPTVTDPGDHAYGRIFTFQNVNVANPFHLVLTHSGRSNDTTTVAHAPGGRTLVDDVMVCNFFAWGNDSAAAQFSGETNASLGLTERSDEGTALGTGGGFGLLTGTLASAGVFDQTTVTVSSLVYCAITLALAPIADLSIGGTVTIDGSPATEGEIVVYDMTQRAASYLVLNEDETTTIPVAGDGTWSALVPYSDHVYIAVYYKAGETEPFEPFISCASDAHMQVVSTVYDIDHFSSGGGGLVPPRVGSAFIR